MTCSFPSKTRTQLDNIIFFTGPPAEKKGRKSASDNIDEWLDIDQILASGGDEGWLHSVAGLDWTAGLDNMAEGEVFVPTLSVSIF